MCWFFHFGVWFLPTFFKLFFSLNEALTSIAWSVVILRIIDAELFVIAAKASRHRSRTERRLPGGARGKYGTSEREGNIFPITYKSAITRYLKLYSQAHC